MKPTTLVYCGEDASAAKALAQSLRDGLSHVVLCSASAFVRLERTCERVVFAPDVPLALQERIALAHGFEVPSAPVKKAPRVRARRRKPSEAAA